MDSTTKQLFCKQCIPASDLLVTYSMARRFFFARNCDPEAAFRQYKESIQTREFVGDINVYENIEVEDYESTRSLVSAILCNRNLKDEI
jgi:hypothetical protein